jgi:hypothetical protein
MQNEDNDEHSLQTAECANNTDKHPQRYSIGVVIRATSHHQPAHSHQVYCHVEEWVSADRIYAKQFRQFVRVTCSLS